MMLLSEMEKDAIGEILNISMGAAATAISSMLDKQVIITTPQVSVTVFEKLDYSSLEPALMVKITYIEGISGTNIMVFRQRDMQMILNQLMGIDEPPKDDYVFDELSMSAASEVMNQMMGASATALSEFLGKMINISTPTAVLMDPNLDLTSFSGYAQDDDVVSVVFNISINDIMESEFACVLSCNLAKMIVSQFVKEESSEHVMVNTTTEEPAQVASPQSNRVLNEAEIQALLANNQEPVINQPVTPPANQPGHGGPLPPSQAPFGYEATQPPAMNGAMPNPYGYPPQYGYPPYGYPPYGYPGYPPMQPPASNEQPSHVGMRPEANNGGYVPSNVNVQNIQFPNFSNQHKPVFAAPITSSNMDLILNVPLNVSVEIGKTKRKIKDIMDFAQGTVIELEKQAGAPVDIVVNGQLIARGDVVVIEDNFGVRVTEIIGVKDIIAASETTKD